MTDLQAKIGQATFLSQESLISIPQTFTIVQAVGFKQAFEQICQEHPDLKRIAFDFSKTSFIDSSGIGALVGCWKIAQKNGIHLVLHNVSQQVMSTLALADLGRLFEIEQRTPDLPRTEQRANLQPNKDIPFVTHPSLNSRTKRVIDIAGALVGLTITGALLVPIAIAIQIDNPGPIFFSQVRCSWMGRRFRIWKFRSMIADAEKMKHLVKNQASGAIFKNSADPRITRVGRFLRKTSLDELPQFWNVLKGEMSLVGTRPPTPDEVECYDIPHWQRLDIKPGMTGEWQVNGRSAVKNFDDVVRLDLKYQENWSLQYDLKLIFKTIWVVFNKDAGAM